MASARVQCGVLGPITVGRDPPKAVRNERQRRLLVALIVAGSEGLSHDALAERVWDDQDRPADTGGSLRTYAHRLRGLLAPSGLQPLVTRPGRYALDGDLLVLDSTCFQDDLAAESEAQGLRERASVLTRGLARWRGPAFDDLAELWWVQPEAVRLDELRLGAQQALLEIRLDLGEHVEVAAESAALLETSPFREGLRVVQMTALYRGGRQADALAAFAEHRDRMVEELGMDASPQLRRLEHLILSQDEALDVIGSSDRPLRGYRLGERLGSGTYSVVHRGAQPSVGRDVAIKVIREELADRPSFVRRFDAEARTIARLEHPHIVPLYDYWREPGRAYLVMRLMRGGSLARSLIDGPWALDRVLELCEQIGGALSVAHRRGVVHRDVKPANILLDQDGNAYLSDFGIAHDDFEVASAIEAGSRSPAYVAPEIVQGETASPSTDVYAFALVVHEMLTGLHPWPNADARALVRHQLDQPLPPASLRRADLPPAVDGLLRAATRKAPTDRHDSVDAFVADLRAALGKVGAPDALRSHAQNPYRGLEAFDEGDAFLFHGRTRLVAELLERMRHGGLLAVVGPSGSGKSSAVHAGLLPLLRSGAGPGGHDWLIARLRPGNDPLGALAESLRQVAGRPIADIEHQLEAGPSALVRVARMILANHNGNMAVVVDQLEELWTLGADQSRIDRFLALLAAAAEHADRLHVVLIVRADHLGQLLTHGHLAAHLRAHTVLVGPMAPEELAEAIVRPASTVGTTVEPALVAELVAAVADRPAALPMLQFLFAEVHARSDGRLRLSDVQDLGGLNGVMAQRAESLHDELDANTRAGMRRLFGRLAVVSKDAAPARASALQAEVLELPGVTSDLLEHMAQARLVTTSHEPQTREPTIEVAHEALLEGWPRLREWLEEDRRWLSTRRMVAADARIWRTEDRDPDALLRGNRLRAATDLVATRADLLSTQEHEFVTASTARRRAERAAEASRTERLHHQSRQLRRRLLAGSLIALVAVMAGLVALDQRRDAQVERQAASLQGMINRALVEAEQRPEIALRLAAIAHAEDPGFDSQRALLSALSAVGTRSERLLAGAHEPPRDPFCGASTPSPGVFVSIVGSDPVAASEMVVHDVVSGQVDRVATPLDCVPVRLPNRGWLGPIRLDDGGWLGPARLTEDPLGGRRWVVTDPSGQPATSLDDDVDWVVGTRAQGQAVVVVDANSVDQPGLLAVADLATGAIVETTDIPVFNATMAPDGSQVLVDTGGDEAAPWQMVDTTDLAVRPVDLPPGDVAWTPDGTELGVFSASIGEMHRSTSDGTPRGAVALPSVPDMGDVHDVDVAPTGELVAVSGLGGVQLMTWPDLRLARDLIRTGQPVAAATWLPDGRLAAIADDGTVTLIDVTASHPAERIITYERGGATLFMAAPGVGNAWELDDSDVFVDLQTGRPIPAWGARPGEQAVQPLSVEVAVLEEPGGHGRIRVLDRDGDVVAVADEPHVPPGLMGVTGWPAPDALRVVAARDGGRDPELAVLDLSTMAITRTPLRADTFTQPAGANRDALWSWAGDDGLQVWDWSGAPLAAGIEIGDRTETVIVDARGDRVFVVGRSGTVEVLDLDTGDLLHLLEADAVGEPPLPVDGSRLVVRTRTGDVVLWDVASGSEIGTLTEVRGAQPLGGANTGYTPMLAEDDASFYFTRGSEFVEFDLDPERWFRHACDLAPEPLTPTQWAELVPDEVPQRDVCAT